MPEGNKFLLSKKEGKLIADDTPDNLAKTIETSHVELYVKDGLKRTIEICEKTKKVYRYCNPNVDSFYKRWQD